MTGGKVMSAILMAATRHGSNWLLTLIRGPGYCAWLTSFDSTTSITSVIFQQTRLYQISRIGMMRFSTASRSQKSLNRYYQSLAGLRPFGTYSIPCGRALTSKNSSPRHYCITASSGDPEIVGPWPCMETSKGVLRKPDGKRRKQT